MPLESGGKWKGGGGGAEGYIRSPSVNSLWWFVPAVAAHLLKTLCNTSINNADSKLKTDSPPKLQCVCWHSFSI